jgi:MFS family permease
MNSLLKRNAIRTLKRSVTLISLPFFILGLLLPVEGRDLGASAVEIGLFFSAFSIMTVILRPLVGWGTDKYGRKPFIAAGMMGYALTMACFAFMNTVRGIIAIRVLQGIASSLLWLTVNAAVSDMTDENNRGTSFGSVMQSSTFGAIIGTFIGFFMLTSKIEIDGNTLYEGQWSHLFIIYALVALAAFILIVKSFPETNLLRLRREQTPIIWSKSWILLLLVTLVTGASWSMVSPIIILFLKDSFNADISQIAFAYLPSALIGAFLPVQLGRLTDRFGRKRLMVIGAIAAAIGSFITPEIGSLLGFAIVWGFLALCFAAGDPAEQALVSDLTGDDQRGRAYGYYAMAADLGATIGPLGGAWLYQVYGKGMPFYANGIILAICGLILAFWLKEPQSRIPDAQELI